MTDLKYLMDEKNNPLSRLPHLRRFQVMIMLSLMWTLIFCLGTGAWLWFGHLATAHVLMALGFLVTGLTFHSAKTTNRTYRDHPLNDGTARYDDVWGG